MAIKWLGGNHSASPGRALGQFIFQRMKKRTISFFTENGGVSILRKEVVTRGCISDVVIDIEASWKEKTEVPLQLNIVHVHDPKRLSFSSSFMKNQRYPFKTLAITAQPNTFMDDDEEEDRDVDEEEGEEHPPSIASSQQKNVERRRRRRRKSIGASLGQHDNATATTATCIAIGFNKSCTSTGKHDDDDIIVFRASDASFPNFEGRPIKNVIQRQPHVLLFARQPDFPLAELAHRLETVFHQTHVLAAYARAVQGEPPKVVVVSDQQQKEEVGAVGLAIFRRDLTVEQLGRIACAVLGSSWLGNFSLDQALQRHLFVPSSYTLGPRPVCAAAVGVHGKDLPLFRLENAVLFPMNKMMLKIFEPRYRRMIKHCIEHDQPFGLVDSGATVGTLCYVSEIYALQENGVSVIQIKGLRRFELKSTYVPPDSFGLLIAKELTYFDDDDNHKIIEDARQLQDLNIQVKAALKLIGAAAPSPTLEKPLPLPSSFPSASPSSATGDQSFTVCQYLIDHFGVSIDQKRKLAWLRSTSAIERMQDCLDLLLRFVRRRGVNARRGAGMGLPPSPPFDNE